MTDTPKPTTVIEALARVMAELPGIAKTPHLSQGGKGLTYAYRGIEEITAEVQGLFAKYGIVIIPRVKSREVKEIVVNGNDWTDTYLEVGWGVYGPSGSIEATTFGMGRDNSDKGTNKAMTQAFKYLLLDMLCISDPADDNDGENVEGQRKARSPEADAMREAFPGATEEPPQRPADAQTLTPAQLKALESIHRARSLDVKAMSIARWGKSPDKLIKSEASRWMDELNGKVKPPEPDAEGRPF